MNAIESILTVITATGGSAVVLTFVGTALGGAIATIAQKLVEI